MYSITSISSRFQMRDTIISTPVSPTHLNASPSANTNIDHTKNNNQYGTQNNNEYSGSKDPYNYTLNDKLSQKSMINRLPGHNKVDLGAHLEIVVLFQAAQIQRLNTLLSTYRGRDKTVTKEQLDRHSYQTQIKQLSIIIDKGTSQRQALVRKIKQLNNVVQSNRYGNASTNLSIKKTQESADGKQMSKGMILEKNSELSVLANKYQRALLQIGKMYDDNTKLQEQVNQLNWQLQQMQHRNQNQTQHFQGHKQNSSLIVQQNKVKQLASQLQRQRSHNKQIQQEFKAAKAKYQSQISNIKSQLSSQQSQTSHIVAQLRQEFTAQLQKYKGRSQQSHALVIQQLQEKLNRHIQQISGLNTQLQNGNTQKWRLQAKIRQYEVKIKEYQAKIRNNQVQGKKLYEIIDNMKRSINGGSLSLSISLQKQKQKNWKSINNQLSINSSFNPNNLSQVHNSKSSKRETYQQLQNKIAMLSQQLQRLVQIASIRNTQIQQLKHQNSQLKMQYENQVHRAAIQHDSQIRKQVLKYNQLQMQHERITKQCTQCKRQLKEKELYIEEQMGKYQENMIRIRQQERKLCEQIYNKRIQYLQLEYGRDREQITRLKKTNHELSHTLDVLQTETSQIRSSNKIGQLKILQKMKQQQDRYEQKLKVAQKYFQEELENTQNNHVLQIQQYKKQLLALSQKLATAQQELTYQINQNKQSQTNWQQEIKRIQQEHTQVHQSQAAELQLKIQKHTRHNKQLEEHYSGRIKEMEGLVRDRDREISKLNQINSYNQNNEEISKSINANYQRILNNVTNKFSDIESSTQHNMQYILKQYQHIIHQLQHLTQQTYSTKSAISNTVSQATQHSSASIQQFSDQISKIGFSLQGICKQFIGISKQMDQFGEILTGYVSGSRSIGQHYNDRYIRQLQQQCASYLQIISNKLTKSGTSGMNSNQNNNDYSMNQILLKQIWQQIQSNNRHIKQQQQKWRQALNRQEDTMQQYLAERQQQLQQKNREYIQMKQQEWNKNEGFSRQTRQRNQQLQRQNKQYRQKIHILEQSLLDKSSIINEYSSKLFTRSHQQDQQLEKLITILQAKTEQLAKLTNLAKQYKQKYEQTKHKCQHIEKIMTKLIQENYKDLQVIDQLQRDHLGLKKQHIRMQKELHASRAELDQVLQFCKSQLRDITQQLSQNNYAYFNHSHNIQVQQGSIHLSIINNQNNNLALIQKQFSKLQNIVHYLNQNNYLTTKQNYNIETHDYVDKQFAYMKLVELNKQIQRLIGENIELKDQIQRCRLELVGYVNNQVRLEQYLSILMLLFVEVQSLRNRVAAHDKQNQNARLRNLRIN